MAMFLVRKVSVYELVLLLICGFDLISAAYQTGPNYFAARIAHLRSPRAIFVDTSGDILVVSANHTSIYALRESSDGKRFERTRIINGQGLRLHHGLAYHEEFIYASSSSSVYRWRYVPGSLRASNRDEVVIYGIPYTGDHTRRAIIFDKAGRLYVTVGSEENVDLDSATSQIRRFQITSRPIDYNTGEIVAEGVRSVRGLAFDQAGDLWGVENGARDLIRDDLGGDISNGNPGEELHRYGGQIGGHHGYPYCFTSDNLECHPVGTQFAWPTFMNDGTHTDAWCRNRANNIPPIYVMPAHSGPVGIEFHSGQGCGNSTGNGSFPCDMQGDAIVAFRGVRDSHIKVGYRVSQIKFAKTGDHIPKQRGNVFDIIFEANLDTCGDNCFRPVSAVFSNKGHLIVSDDQNNQIIRVTYGGLASTASKNAGISVALIILSTILKSVT